MLPLSVQNLSEDRQQGADIRAGGCGMIPPTSSSWARMMEHCWDLGTVPAPQLPAQGSCAAPGTGAWRDNRDSKISTPADRGATQRPQRPSTGSPLPARAGAGPHIGMHRTRPPATGDTATSPSCQLALLSAAVKTDGSFPPFTSAHRKWCPAERQAEHRAGG